ncbi:hypothetical protein [Bradyrhizobium sp. CCBAU 51753]|uniref:hypothetical protein n=1 Tax=Bradyrhizobium sp. CCBAU 51753 TaxID=1325100 RepID=UPI00188A29CD|nr:hypothetical protein [Bradyrhizobium sp. CCBAU 51753]
MPDTLPPFPTIDSLSWAPPAQTAPTEAARIDNVSLNIYADADNANYQDWVSDVPRGSGNPRLNNWWSGQAPRSPRRLVLRHYWRLVPGTFTHLSPGQPSETELAVYQRHLDDGFAVDYRAGRDQGGRHQCRIERHL